MTKNIKSLVLLAIFSVVILSVFFFVFRGDDDNAKPVSIDNYQSIDAPKSDEDGDKEANQGIEEGALSGIPQSLKGLQFTDKYKRRIMN